MITTQKSKTLLPALVLLIGCLVLIALAGQVVSAQAPTAELTLPFRFAERPKVPTAVSLPPVNTLAVSLPAFRAFSATESQTASTIRARRT